MSWVKSALDCPWIERLHGRNVGLYCLWVPTVPFSDETRDFWREMMFEYYQRGVWHTGFWLNTRSETRGSIGQAHSTSLIPGLG